MGYKQEWLAITKELEREKNRDELLERGDHLIISKIKKLPAKGLKVKKCR